jgi:cysteine-S-conjugate beta-lyase
MVDVGPSTLIGEDDRVNPLRQLTLDQLRARTSEKWRAYPPDVLPVFVAEMDVPLAGPVARAATDAITLGDTGYVSGTAYAEAYAAFAATRWGWDDIAVERTVVVPDVMLGIVEVLLRFTAPGGPVVVTSPCYPPYYPFVENIGRRVVEAPLGPDYRLDLDVLGETFERLAGERAAFLLCSPHNPTGVVHTRDELATVARLAGQYGVRVVADEIHAPLVLPGADFVPYLTVPGGEDGIAVVSASKGWNLAGLKAALAIAGPGAVDDLRRFSPSVSDGASHVGVQAHTAALRSGVEWLDALLAGLAENRTLLGDLLTEHLPAVGYLPPAATYLAWLDCRPLDLDDDPAAVFLDRGRVALYSGPRFGTGGAGHVRFNLATSPQIVTEAVRRMASATAPL